MAQLTSAFFQKILAIEGGYQNHSGDRGNYCNNNLIGTKYGMSAVAVSVWLGRCPTVSEMKGMTTQNAQGFYGWYFDLYRLFEVENQELFELLANNTMGSPTNAAKVEQRVLNSFGYSLDVDGVRGDKTLAALNDAWRTRGAELYNAIREAWIQYLVSLNRPEFLPGWLKRMEKFPPLGTKPSSSFGGGGILIAIVALIILTKNG